MILEHEPFFNTEWELQPANCANVTVFYYIYGSIYMPIDLYICVSHVRSIFKFIKLNQLSIFDGVFKRHFVYAGVRSCLAA